MTDDRTPQQRAADEALHEAIRNNVAAYSLGGGPATVITNWVIVGTGLRACDRGDINQSFIILPDNGVRTSDETLIGLLRAALIRAEHHHLMALGYK